jgi:hypothetical protein
MGIQNLEEEKKKEKEEEEEEKSVNPIQQPRRACSLV